MKDDLLPRYVILLSLLVLPFGRGQAAAADTTPQLALEPPPAESANRFSLSYRMGFNIGVGFKNVGSFGPLGHPVLGQGPYPQPGNPGPATGGAVNRTYEDGYNWLDDTGNQQGLTRYWGYDSAGQVQGNAMVMHSTSSPGMDAGERSADPLQGFEVTYERVLFRREHWRGGLVAAFGYSPLSISDARPLSVGVNRISDAFTLGPAAGGGLIVPPSAPYSGPYTLVTEGDPVIHDSPVRTTTLIPGSISGQRCFSADLFGFRLGPCLEIPLSRKVSFTLDGGFALVYVSSDFRFNETVSIPGVGSASNAGSGSHSGWLPGGYVAGNISVALSDSWALVAGAQFEDVGHYTQNLNGKQATLDLSKSIFVTVGLSYSF